MTARDDKPALNGCSVLPPMDDEADRHQDGDGKPSSANGKASWRQSGERFRVLNAFVDFTLAGLSRNDIAVWLTLYRDTKGNGTARTSQAELARRAGITDRTVRRAIERLSRLGLLRVVRRGGIGRGPSAYVVHPIPPQK